MLTNLTDTVSALKERLHSMEQAAEWAKEKGQGSKEDTKLLAPLTSQISALQMQIVKVGSVLKNAKVAYGIAKSNFGATVQELSKFEKKQASTGATGTFSGNLGPQLSLTEQHREQIYEQAYLA